MKEYLRKNGIKVAIIVVAVVLLIGIAAAARGGQISAVQNVTGILEAPLKRVLSSAVNWVDGIYGYIFEYDSLRAENEVSESPAGRGPGIRP